MEFIPATGVNIDDLRILADRLLGTQDNLQDHVSVLGLETDCLSSLFEDLEVANLASKCDACELWTRPGDLELGLCSLCYEEETEDLDDLLDEFDGFSEEDFDDEGIFDETFEDYVFDETEDEDDL